LGNQAPFLFSLAARLPVAGHEGPALPFLSGSWVPACTGPAPETLSARAGFAPRINKPSGEWP